MTYLSYQKSKKLYFLQVMRAVACLMVITMHFLADAQKYNRISFDPTIYSIILSKGVDVFFIISGFIMVYIQQDKIEPLSFLKKRFLRIYPIYYEFTLLALIVWIFNPLLFNNAVGNKTDILSSLLLIPPKPGYLHLINVSWSLCYEIWFYIIFAISLIVLKKNYIYGLVIYGVVVTIFKFLGIESGRFTQVFGSSFVMEFVCGALYCYYFKYKNRFTILFLISFILIFIKLDIIIFIVTISTFVIFEFLIIYEKYYKFPAFIVLIGDASYTLYLTHVLVMSTLKYVLNKIEVFYNMPNFLWILIMTISPIIFGMLHYKLIEKKFLNFCKSK